MSDAKDLDAGAGTSVMCSDKLLQRRAQKSCNRKDEQVLALFVLIYTWARVFWLVSQEGF